mmetsp:Transcript_16271/g.41230  ORF Transcript_16271/g.41230 Transcript_16271/m.41230 type:complete len:280 (-) Transcript_16271:108-947(-)
MPQRRKSSRGDRRRSAILQSTIDENAPKTDFGDDEHEQQHASPRKKSRRTSSSMFESIPPTLPESRRLGILAEKIYRSEVYKMRELAEKNGESTAVVEIVEVVVEQFLEKMKEKLENAQKIREEKEKERDEKERKDEKKTKEQEEIKQLQSLLRQYEMELGSWEKIMEEAREVERMAEKEKEKVESSQSRSARSTRAVVGEAKEEVELCSQLRENADQTIGQTLNLLGRKFDAMHRIVKTHRETEAEAARVNQEGIEALHKVSDADFEDYLKEEGLLLP